eukprot:XP_013982480.1 PREDICTED: stereocilin-like isoform X1 [Salmo salar]
MELIEVLDGETFLRDMSLYRDLPWSPQQAQLLFKRTHQSEIITRETVEDLGHIAGGMSCDWLKLWTNETDFSELLQFVSELPGGVRPALVRNHKLPTWYPSCPPPLLFPSHSFLLSIFRYIFLSRKVFLELFRASYFILVCFVLCYQRKCVVEELRQRPEEDLDGISPWFAAELPVNLIESLSNTSLTAILAHIQQHFVDFLKLPRHKQMALAEKAITVLGTSQGLAEGEPLWTSWGPCCPSWTGTPWGWWTEGPWGCGWMS